MLTNDRFVLVQYQSIEVALWESFQFTSVYLRNYATVVLF